MAIRQLWLLLTVRQKRAVLGLFILSLAGVFMEMLGLGLVVPLVALMTINDPAAAYPFLAPLMDALGRPSREVLILMVLSLMAALYFLKALFMTLVAWQQAGFHLHLQMDLSRRLYETYLRQPWLFHLRTHTSHLIQNVNQEILLLIQYGYGSLVEIMTNGLLLIMMAVLLLSVEPTGTLIIIGVMGAAGLIFQVISRRILVHWGGIRQQHETLRLQSLQQGLSSVRDIKMRQRESFYTGQFHTHSLNLIESGRWQSTLRRLPRYIFEWLAVVGVSGCVLSMMASGKPLEAIAPVIGLFAAVFVRLMPSLNNIMIGLHGIRYIRPTIELMTKEFALPSTLAVSAAHDLPISADLTLDHVTFSYQEGEGASLENITLHIPFGSSAGFIGPSGAGKSTLIDVILGLLPPQSGHVRVGDVDIQDNLPAWHRQVGYVPQSLYLMDDTLRRNIAFGVADGEIDEAALRRAIEAAQLQSLLATLPEGLDTKLSENGSRFSGGERQRIGIARALYHDPAILLLDEATASLDTETEAAFMAAVQALKGRKTILIVTHRLSTIAGCDQIVQLESGRIRKIDVA